VDTTRVLKVGWLEKNQAGLAIRSSRISSPVRHGFVNPYNFLNPLNTDFNPSTTGLLYARVAYGQKKRQWPR
jgi:hypothetical protein